jgi:hypothetical protein
MPSYATAASILSDMRDASLAMADCYDANGYINPMRYLHMLMTDGDDELDSMAEDSLNNETDLHHGGATKEKKTREKRIILARRTPEGELEEIPPTESLWWHMYVSCPQYDDPKFIRKFRRRFRLPYTQFTTFVEEAKKENWFPRWMGKDATGKNASPLELLILGAFRYLGRGFTFDDLEEVTAISEEVHRQFFHKFIEVGSTTLYEKYVTAPQNEKELEEHMHEFIRAGMPGAFASMDATHIIHDMCNWRSRRAHVGHKSKYATRTYNMMVNHRRRILGTTRGHPGSFNDKTLILFDEFVQDVKSGKFDDYTFELLEKRGDEIVAVKYKGVWIVVDNGYHNWSITIPPIPNSDSAKEIRWSEWVESMRKDVGKLLFYDM